LASLLEAEQTIVNGEGTVSAPVDQILAVIDGSPAFADLPPAARRALAGICHEVRFSTGQRLVSITQPLTRVFILASGRAKLAGVTENGLERILNVYHLAAMSNDATVRLAKLLLDFAADQDVGDGELVELKHPLTHETMAQMIGASRPHTTSLLGTLEQRRAIRRLKPRGLLVSPPRLKAILQQSGERDQAI
jgi:CRP-like cAMP-binding protein